MIKELFLIGFNIFNLQCCEWPMGGIGTPYMDVVFQITVQWELIKPLSINLPCNYILFMVTLGKNLVPKGYTVPKANVFGGAALVTKSLWGVKRMDLTFRYFKTHFFNDTSIWNVYCYIKKHMFTIYGYGGAFLCFSREGGKDPDPCVLLWFLQRLYALNQMSATLKQHKICLHLPV